MSELQNENEVLVGEVTELGPAEETKDESLGKLGIALIGLAAIGTVAVGKAAYKGGKKLVRLVRDKIADAKGECDNFVEEDEEPNVKIVAESETEEETEEKSEKK